MTKAIRWSDDELDAYKNRLIKKSQGAAMPQKQAAGKVPDVAPPAAVSDPYDSQWTKDEIAAMAASVVAPLEINKIVCVPAPAAAPKKVGKYRNRKVEHEGMTFDSEKELRRWRVLVLMQDAGHITELRRQVAFELAPAVRLDGEARMKTALRYIADAVYVQDGKLIVEDVKSKPTRTTAIYRAKKHLLATVHNLQIKEV